MARRIIARRRPIADGKAINLVSMIDIFTILVFFLLVNSVAIAMLDPTSIINLDLARAVAPTDTLPPQKLEVTVRSDRIVVGDTRGGAIATLAPTDLSALRVLMIEMKRRQPEQREISVLLERDVPYQNLVLVLDQVRGYPVPLGDKVVQAELFPVIALGDAPPLTANATAHVAAPMQPAQPTQTTDVAAAAAILAVGIRGPDHRARAHGATPRRHDQRGSALPGCGDGQTPGRVERPAHRH